MRVIKGAYDWLRASQLREGNPSALWRAVPLCAMLALTWTCGGSSFECGSEGSHTKTGDTGQCVCEAGYEAVGNDVVVSAPCVATISTPCETTASCPQDFVCDRFRGECTACRMNADCGDQHSCSGGECVFAVPCSAAQDCIPHDAFCDFARGVCVECIDASHCDTTQACLTGSCVDFRSCAADADCTDLNMICAAAGTGWPAAISTTCQECSSNAGCAPGESCRSSICTQNTDVGCAEPAYTDALAVFTLYVSSLCDWYATCATEIGRRYPDKATCESARLEMPSLYMGNFQAHPDADACLASFGTATCGGHPTCAVYAPARRDGDCCSAITIVSGCEEGLACTNGRCRAPVSEIWDLCGWLGPFCGADQYCNEFLSSPACLRRAEEGESCFLTECVSGLGCSTMETCAPIVPAGGTCDASSPCDWDSYCNSLGVCTLAGDVGAQCASDRPCQYGLFCHPARAECVLTFALGDECTAYPNKCLGGSKNCVEDTFDIGHCVDGADVGEACSTPADPNLPDCLADFGLECDSQLGVCVDV